MTLTTIVLLCLMANSSRAQGSEVITMWVGEYLPYTGSQLPGGGPLTQIVARALEMITLGSEVKYANWAEIPQKLETGNSISFPYAKNAERLSKFSYSDLVISVRSHFFAYGERPSNLFKNKAYWRGKTHCRPRTWDMESFDERYKELALKHVHPDTLEECFDLMKSGKVDLVQMSDPVVWNLLRERYKTVKGFKTLEDGALTAEFFVIVSKANPKARAILASFNQGLQQLKTSGEYKRILERSKFRPEAGTSTQGGRGK